jgi:hypothetical protein
MTYSCDTCHAPVSADQAFVRSINLRSVAWCRSCWAARHPELQIPVQRQASATEPAPAPRRWLPPVLHES